jgi:hypothetical protein
LRLHVSGVNSGLAYRVPLHDGERGTAQTVKLMRQLIDQAVSDAQFVRFAIELVRNVPPYDEYGEVSALFQWVQHNIRYTKDPVTKEKLYPPMELLKIQAGDCDDISMLLGALAIALGYPARLITVAADPSSPSEFSHVYTEVECPPGSGSWIAVDAARPGSQFGLQPPAYFRKRAWSLTDNTHTDLNGATRLRGLSGYHRHGVHGLGDDGGIDWGSILSQSLAQTPQIIAAVSGQSSSVRLPNGTIAATGPYSSFATPYTPGYAVPAAGYGALGATQMVSSSMFSTMLPWILIGVVGIAVFKR